MSTYEMNKVQLLELFNINFILLYIIPYYTLYALIYLGGFHLVGTSRKSKYSMNTAQFIGQVINNTLCE